MADLRTEHQGQDQGENRLVGTITTGDKTEVRVTLRTWNGRTFGDFRTHVRMKSGTWTPTVRGFTLAPELLEELELAVRKLRVLGSATPRRPE